MTFFRSAEAKGTLFVLAAAFLWGTSGVAGKHLFSTGVTPLALVQARSAIAAVCLGALLLARRPSLLSVRRDDLPLALALGFILAETQWTYFFAISKIHVAAAILLQYLAPVIVAVAGWLWLKDRPSPLKMLSIALAVGGCWLVVGGGAPGVALDDLVGVASGVASAFGFAGYAVISEKMMHRYTPWTASFHAFLWAALFLNLARVDGAFPSHAYTTMQWGWLLYVGVLGTAAPFTLFILGINHVRASRAAVTGTVEPLCAGVFAWLLLGETMNAVQLAGGAVTLAAIALLQLDRTGMEGSPEKLRALKIPEPLTARLPGAEDGD